MITKEQYLHDPCRTSSVPYWKAVRILVPAGMQILHADDFRPEMLAQFWDEPYFRLFHDLQGLEQAVLPPGFSLCKAMPREFAAHIHACYGNGMTAAEVALWMGREVYCADLWLAVRDEETGQIVATGIGELDTRLGEGALEWIQVSAGYRHKGLGAYLVRELLWRMKDKAEFATVSGQCHNPTAPEGVYRRCGFTGRDVWHILRQK